MIGNNDQAVNILQEFRKRIEKEFEYDSGYITNAELQAISKLFIREIRKLDHCYLYSYSQFRKEKHDFSNLYVSNNYDLNDFFEGTWADCKEGILTREEMECFNNQAYVKCFTENYDDIKMWGLYADNGKGICVEYDLTLLEDDILMHLYPIYYSSDRKIYISHEDLDTKHITKEEVRGGEFCWLLNKPDVWRDEHEWRMVFFSNKLIPIKCVTKVLCGPKMKDTDINLVYDMNLKNKCKIYKTALDRMTYNIRILQNLNQKM